MQCQCRIHQRLKEKCELAQSLPVKGGDTQMESKQAFIQRLIDHSEPSGHGFKIQTNYLVCNKCGVRTLKNSARDKIKQLCQSPCWSGKWDIPPTWTGNPTRVMLRRRNKIWCQVCKACALPKGGDWQASKQLQKPCSKAEKQHELHQANGRSWRSDIIHLRQFGEKPKHEHQ